MITLMLWTLMMPKFSSIFQQEIKLKFLFRQRPLREYLKVYASLIIKMKHPKTFHSMGWGLCKTAYFMEAPPSLLINTASLNPSRWCTMEEPLGIWNTIIQLMKKTTWHPWQRRVILAAIHILSAKQKTPSATVRDGNSLAEPEYSQDSIDIII